MASLAQQAMMLDALTGDLDRDFPMAAQAYREEAAANPQRHRRIIEEAARRREEKR